MTQIILRKGKIVPKEDCILVISILNHSKQVIFAGAGELLFSDHFSLGMFFDKKIGI